MSCAGVGAEGAAAAASIVPARSRCGLGKRVSKSDFETPSLELTLLANSPRKKGSRVYDRATAICLANCIFAVIDVRSVCSAERAIQ